METAVIRVSSKGQIVIPSAWRKRMGVGEGTELIAIGEGDTLLLKKMERSTLKREFDETVAAIRKKAKKLGIARTDVERAVKRARSS